METKNEQLEFRTLRADEISVRYGNANKNKTGATFLLYKNARVDMDILDEKFTPYGWKREHKELKGVIYCGVSIRDPQTGEWITKWDAGAESNQDAEKGEASDSFKRACTNWGLGRELYSAPRIFFFGNDLSYKKMQVSEIEYNAQRKISKLVLVEDGKEVYRWFDDGKQATESRIDEALEVKSIEEAHAIINNILTAEECERIGAYWSERNPILFELVKFEMKTKYNNLTNL